MKIRIRSSYLLAGIVILVALIAIYVALHFISFAPKQLSIPLSVKYSLEYFNGAVANKTLLVPAQYYKAAESMAINNNVMARNQTLYNSILSGNTSLSTNEIAPTKLQNPAKFKLFESFVRFYSLPKSNEIDPTIFFGAIFPIFFGFMVGDVGYGLFMFFMFYWISRRITNPPKKSRIPRSLARFIHTILSNRGLLILSKAVMIGAIVGIAFGFLFNNFFGFKMPYPTPFNVQTQLSTLLLVAGWIGVVMVEFGYVLGIINKLSINDRKGAIGRAGWFIAAIGIVIFGLNILEKASIRDINSIAGMILLPVGVALILKSEGSEALMEIPSVVSHILSYMRLVGILLASVILAEVIDKIFIANTKISFLLGLVGGIILIFGQLFNIVIAIFEGGIQGARLIYVEFFSKFFSGNGKIFKPFGVSRKRTNYKFKIDEP